MSFTDFCIGFGCGGFFIMLVFLREIVTAPPRAGRRFVHAPIILNRYEGANEPRDITRPL